jgi:2-polyprenyl-3-methyl-5-hydroxy-6-metoxy-1,4-benzoquinol methylase
VGCRSCGLVQTNPRPTAEGLETFYRHYYRLYYQGTEAPDSGYVASLNKGARLAYTAAYFAKDLKLPADAAILDYGCGEGSLFAALRRADFVGAFYGVELNAGFGKFASHYGSATVTNAIPTNVRVDLVIVNHVLEHLADPIGTLAQLGRLLTPQGRLYIDVPDVEAYAGIQDLHLAHIFHFSERTLRCLVMQAGFVVELVERHAPPSHPRSVRLVAHLGAAPASDTVTSQESERRAWAAVKHSGSAWNTIRLRLGRISIVHRVYQSARRLARRLGV